MSVDDMGDDPVRDVEREQEGEGMKCPRICEGCRFKEKEPYLKLYGAAWCILWAYPDEMGRCDWKEEEKK